MLRRLLTFLLLAPLAHAAESQSPRPGSPLALLRQIDEGFVQIFEKVAPTVVVIEVLKKADEAPEESKSLDFFPDEGKEAKARENSGKPEAPRGWRLPQQRSEGSGFFLREDGHIVTNLHVIAEAEKLNVRLRDGRSATARLIASDEPTDIAVLKIEAKNIVPVELGDSDKLRVGQLVCAIGTPFHQEYSFTCGWVSGKGRTNLLSSTSPNILFEDYIQTDAFINPGNSGGPLFDVEGKVIGMMTLINRFERDLAFAIPSNVLKQIADQLIAAGRMVRPWLGIRIETLSQNPAVRERVPELERGVVVDTVEANAPAYRSDLRPADIILDVDGTRIGTAHELQKEISRKKVGQVLQLTVWRNGVTRKIPVTTGELPAEPRPTAFSAPRAAPAPPP
jgi:S1-C subfamily serine protease